MRTGFLKAVFISLLISSCAYEAEDSSLKKPEEFAGNVADRCFDAQMNTWIQKFNEYQNKGLDMFTADSKAKEAALKAFNHCTNKHGGLAIGQPRKD